jgi:hypothetical protein
MGSTETAAGMLEERPIESPRPMPATATKPPPPVRAPHRTAWASLEFHHEPVDHLPLTIAPCNRIYHTALFSTWQSRVNPDEVLSWLLSRLKVRNGQ